VTITTAGVWPVPAERDEQSRGLGIARVEHAGDQWLEARVLAQQRRRRRDVVDEQPIADLFTCCLHAATLRGAADERQP
jgi:hypothetical protein